MKNITTLLAAIITTTSMSYSQSENLVQYQIDVTTKVNTISIKAHSDGMGEKSSVGRIESIYESTINLELNTSRDYTILINNEIAMEIKKSDIAEYVAQQNRSIQIVDNSNAPTLEEKKTGLSNGDQSNLVYRLQVGAFENDNLGNYFNKLSDLKTETIDGTSITRYMSGDYDNSLTANSSLELIKEQGYLDAFVVAYLNGERISINVAIAYEQNSKNEDVNSINSYAVTINK